MLSVHSRVGQQTVGFGVVIVVITEVGVLDFGGGVDAGDGVDLGLVAALAAVVFEAAWHAVGLDK
jgi:hypothetical protein